MKLFTALENEEIDIPADGADTLEEQIMAQDECVRYELSLTASVI